MQSPELGRRFAIQWRRRKSRCGCERFRSKTLGSKSHGFYFSHGSIIIGVDDDHNPKVTVKNLLGVLFLEVWAISICVGSSLTERKSHRLNKRIQFTLNVLKNLESGAFTKSHSLDVQIFVVLWWKLPLPLQFWGIIGSLQETRIWFDRCCNLVFFHARTLCCT